jgi:ABC-type amino acid transport substrate-binding protein
VKNTFKTIIFTCILIIFSGVYTFATTITPLKLTASEKLWIYKNKDKIFTLGINPGQGMEYFNYKNEQRGYLIPLIAIIEKDLGININLKISKNWGQVYSALHSGTIDILFGANETSERKKTMFFTPPIYKTPYALISKSEGSIHTIGDIDKMTVGFIKDDIVIDLLPTIYKNINYEKNFMILKKILSQQ